ncbi:hypothetical protein [Bacillus chungangensis]|uniref:PepSY domain-containing protein n=1 Tax=Bacillus chungangensis TaxID=587633 RepID=A0ABT9WYH8_9BACI|nr:hypothetical protein [Bacillus chungangensis]MDQ0178272.1 hypothetical protein [Bacillus chungangensis]
MKTNKLKRSGFKKAALAGLVMIGSGALLSPEFTHAASAEAIKQTTPITTSYANHTTNSFKVAQTDNLSDYKKANYTVKQGDSQKPTSSDITKEAAAEIGAKALWELFEQNLEGQVVRISYNQPLAPIFDRSHWRGSVQISDKLFYHFAVDAVTGEIESIGRFRLDKKPKASFDEIVKNPQEYEEAAKKLAEKYNVVNSPVKSVELGGGSGEDLSFSITGENGEKAFMSISSIDKALLSITFVRD